MDETPENAKAIAVNKLTEYLKENDSAKAITVAITAFLEEFTDYEPMNDMYRFKYMYASGLSIKHFIRKTQENLLK